MTRPRTIVYALFAAAILVVAGAYGGFALADARSTQWGWTCHAMSTETYVDVLRKLRTNNVKDAQDTMEKRLDMHVWLMQDRSETLAASTGLAPQALTSVKRYRLEFPWTGGDPKINAEVADALSKVDAGK